MGVNKMLATIGKRIEVDNPNTKFIVSGIVNGLFHLEFFDRANDRSVMKDFSSLGEYVKFVDNYKEA